MTFFFYSILLNRHYSPDFPVIEEIDEVVTTTTDEVPPADKVGLGRILLVVDGTPCVIIFIPEINNIVFFVDIDKWFIMKLAKFRLEYDALKFRTHHWYTNHLPV